VEHYVPRGRAADRSTPRRSTRLARTTISYEKESASEDDQSEGPSPPKRRRQPTQPVPGKRKREGESGAARGRPNTIVGFNADGLRTELSGLSDSEPGIGSEAAYVDLLTKWLQQRKNENRTVAMMGISEHKLEPGQSFEIEGYDTHARYRTKIREGSRGSGGVLVLVHEDLAPYVTRLEDPTFGGTEGIIVLRYKHAGRCEYFVVAYFEFPRPEKAQVYEFYYDWGAMVEELEKLMGSLGKQGKVILSMDSNHRIGDQDEGYENLDPLKSRDTEMKHVSKLYGSSPEALMQCLRANDLAIANGRLCDPDFTFVSRGWRTTTGTKGCSTIDFVCIPREYILQERVRACSVDCESELYSDHRPVIVTFEQPYGEMTESGQGSGGGKRIRSAQRNFDLKRLYDNGTERNAFVQTADAGAAGFMMVYKIDREGLKKAANERGSGSGSTPQRWLDALTQSLIGHAPTKAVGGRGNVTGDTCPWWSSAVASRFKDQQISETPGDAHGRAQYARREQLRNPENKQAAEYYGAAVKHSKKVQSQALAAYLQIRFNTISQEIKRNPRIAWRVLGSLGHPRTKKSKPITALVGEKGERITDSKEIANTLAKFYAEVSKTAASTEGPDLDSERIKQRQRTATAILEESRAKAQSDESLKRYEEACERGDNGSLKSKPLKYTTPESTDTPISLQEVSRAIRLTSSGRAPGIDRVPIELFKILHNEGNGDSIRALRRFYCLLYGGGRTSESLLKALVAVIFKKGRTTNPGNYRGVHMKVVIFRIYDKILDMRLRDLLESYPLSDEQCGGRNGRSTTDQVSALIGLIANNGAKHRRTYTGFVDVWKGFPSHPAHGIWIELYEMKGLKHSDGRLLTALAENYRHRTFAVRNGTEVSTPQDQVDGISEGTSSGPTMFSVGYDPIVRVLRKAGCTVTVGYVEIAGLLFVDDLAVACRSAGHLQHALNILYTYGKECKVTYNHPGNAPDGIGKTQVVVFGKCGTYQETESGWMLGDVKLPEMSSYTYLGTCLHQALGSTTHVRGERVAVCDADYEIVNRTVTLDKDEYRVVGVTAGYGEKSDRRVRRGGPPAQVAGQTVCAWMVQDKGDKSEKWSDQRLEAALATATQWRTVDRTRFLMAPPVPRPFMAHAAVVRKKAAYVVGELKRSMVVAGGPSVEAAMHILRTRLSTVIDYGLASWGASADLTGLDGLEMKAARTILGVGPYTTMEAVKYEMGIALPTDRLMIEQCMLEWRISKGFSTPFCKAVAEESRQIQTQSGRERSSNGVPNAARERRLTLQMLELWPIPDDCSKKLWRKRVAGKVEDLVLKKLRERIWGKAGTVGDGGTGMAAIGDGETDGGASKLEVMRLSTQRKKLGIAPYLIGPTLDRVHQLGREVKCRLRLGSHTLAVEMGRWNGTARDDRTCTLCRKGVEDAEHFAVHCSDRKALVGGFVSSIIVDVSRIVKLSQPPTESQRTRLFALMMSDDCPDGMAMDQWQGFETKVYLYLACAMRARDKAVEAPTRRTDSRKVPKIVREEASASIWPRRSGDEE